LSYKKVTKVKCKTFYGYAIEGMAKEVTNMCHSQGWRLYTIAIIYAFSRVATKSITDREMALQRMVILGNFKPWHWTKSITP